MNRASIVLGLLLSIVSASASAQDALANVTHAPPATPHVATDSFFRDSAPSSCGPRRGIPVEPGFFAALGALGRDLESDVAIAGGDDALGGSLSAAGAARIDDHLFALARLTGALSHRFPSDTSVGSLPAVDLGLGARSDCDRWNVQATLGWAPTGTSDGAPSDWQVAIPSALVLGPTDAYLYLPRAASGAFSLAFDARVRTDGEDVFGAFRLFLRIGTGEVRSVYGDLRGFTGALAFEGAIGLRAPWGVTLNLELGARFEVDLSSFWPSNAVGPFALAIPLRWSPDRAVALEVWGAFTDFLVAERTDLPPAGPAFGARLQLFGDL